jgi:hypothetical protein
MTLSHKWTQHLRGEEANKFRELLLVDTVILGRLLAIVEEMEREVEQSDLSINEYTNPAFPYLKADRNGEIRGLKKVQSLLSFLKE